MPRDDDAFERLSAAIDHLAAEDAPHVLDEARADARARVRAKLTDAIERSLLEQLGQPERVDSAPDEAPPATQATDGEQGCYVYGVVDGRFEPPTSLTGVDPAETIAVVPEDDVAAVVSSVALAQFGEDQLREQLADMGWVETVARAHERVLDEIRDLTTVIPMRMCTVYRSEAGVREMLRRESDALRDAIDRLDGKAEWGVKVFADLSAASAASADGVVVGDTDDARGAAYMRRRRDEREHREQAMQRIDEAVGHIHERLRALAADGHTAPPQRPEVSGHDGAMVLNGVYLVADDARDRFEEEVRRLESEFGDRAIQLVLTGPWPAYNFVPGTIGEAW
jgi:hypothetical protein